MSAVGRSFKGNITRIIDAYVDWGIDCLAGKAWRRVAVAQDGNGICAWRAHKQRAGAVGDPAGESNTTIFAEYWIGKGISLCHESGIGGRAIPDFENIRVHRQERDV